MKKGNRFYLKRYFSDIPLGWGLYSDEEIEEKVYCTPFLYASEHFQEKFQDGDESAIFKFVKNWPECFREVWPLPKDNFVPCYSNNIIRKPGGRSWIVEQIEKWKAEDTPEARKKIKKLFSAYADSRGQKNKMPGEDWEIYRQIKKKLNRKSRLSRGDITKAILEVVNSNNRIEKELNLDLQRRLMGIPATTKKNKILLREILILIGKETDTPYRKLAAYIKTEKTFFNTYKEIYYKLKKLEKQYQDYLPITDRDL